MSTVDQLLATAATSDTNDRPGFTRDRWDRPLIIPADGGDPIPYTRSSTAAKTIDDDYNLQRWQRRLVAYGVAHDPSLVARILAMPGKPDEWEKPGKDAANDIAEDAMKVAQAHKNADIGTAVHAMTERLDAGEDVMAGPWQADIEAYSKALTAAGLKTHRDWIECTIVCDELQMAGTADRILEVLPTSPLVELYHLTPGDYLIGDLKTGSTVDFGGLGFAAQLAAYANGTLYDPGTDTRLATPPMSKRWGIIIHLPAGRGVCTLYMADLEAGLEAAHLANKVREARRASKGWLQPIAYGSETVTDEQLHELLAQSVPQPSAPAPHSGADPLLQRLLASSPEEGTGVGGGEAAAAHDNAASEPPASDPIDVAETAANLRARWQTCLATPGHGITPLHWPNGVPLFKDGGPTTVEQLAKVQELVVQTEARLEVPFPDTPPRPPVTRPEDLLAPPEPKAMVEKPTAEQLEALKARVEVLPDDLRTDATRRAHEGGLPVERHAWSLEHLPVLEEAIATAEALHAQRIGELKMIVGDLEPELVLALRSTAGVSDVAVEQITADQASLLLLLAIAVDRQLLGLQVDLTGDMVLVTVAGTAEAALIERHGGRTQVLAAAKDAAPTWGRPKPKATAEVASDPVLVAVLTAPEDTTHEPAASSQEQGETT